MGKRAEKIWIIAGEASGDLYGAELARELMAARPGVKVSGMGGAAMKAAGVGIIVDSTELGIVGIVEVFKKIPFFMGLLKRLSRQASEERPDAVVLIDYPGFNIRLAERLHHFGIPVVYYISPQVWAWKKGRIPKIARSIERMLCIFPFEPKVYEGTGLDAEREGQRRARREAYSSVAWQPFNGAESSCGHIGEHGDAASGQGSVPAVRDAASKGTHKEPCRIADWKHGRAQADA